MRQLLQSFADGTTSVTEVPCPEVPVEGLLIRTTRSLISSGTERALVSFARAGWIERARQQPERVGQFFDKVRSDGLLPALEAVRSRLEDPLPLGYCNVGIVVAVGAGVRGFSVGDRVVSNGPHAEFVAAGRNLCAHVPDRVSDEEATFTVVGAIALQGMRLAIPTLGEHFAVIGLGVIGLLAVQLLRANGCQVFGLDPNRSRCELARSFGAEVITLDGNEDPVAVAASLTDGRGIDGVLVTAATSSSEPVSLAARMSRKRGRIVLVGVSGLQLNRQEFYEKELSFQVSCSYGPGRYDRDYEELGLDYPIGLVRWTEQRNFEAVLQMLAARRIATAELITHRYTLATAGGAYDVLASDASSCLGIVLEYPSGEEIRGAATIALPTPRRNAIATPSIAFIGAGNYAKRMLIPAFHASGAVLRTIVSHGGVSASHCGRKFGFERASTDSNDAVAADDVDVVVIATRHDTHARLVVQALRAGKHVFVEKPVAISNQEISEIAGTYQSCIQSGHPVNLMVGFNRRFAPHTQRMKELLQNSIDPKCVLITVNAGAIPFGHWTRDLNVGGGRIVGEACHFIDLARYLVGHPIVGTRVQALGSGTASDDQAAITLTFADGSWATIHYLANGHRSFPKERVEVFCGGRVLQLDNFRTLRAYGWPGFRKMRLWRQDKGQYACVAAFVQAVRSGAGAVIPVDEILEVGRVTIAVGEAARA